VQSATAVCKTRSWPEPRVRSCEELWDRRLKPGFLSAFICVHLRPYRFFPGCYRAARVSKRFAVLGHTRESFAVGD
jgi:hypothetical protein